LASRGDIMNTRAIRSRRLLAVAALAVLILVPYTAGAISATVELVEAAVIHDPECEGRARLLLRFEMPEELTSGVVDMAVATLEIQTSQQGSSIVPTEAHAITRSWDSGTVAWDEGWASGDGSWDDTMMCSGDVRFGDSPALVLDVSEVLGERARARASDFSLVILGVCDAFLMPADVMIAGGHVSLDYSIVE